MRLIKLNTPFTNKSPSYVGEMRSHRKEYGLALLRIDAAKSGKALHSENATLTPSLPKWMVLPQTRLLLD
ncbi:MAG TPA: hypothetical protein DDX01_03100 [Holosporales bacterium]|nr:MAG: hypothetical protein A2W06_06195 [Alphaproteobacteria bacterium RBG_16_42_14]OFW90474.1 MAG: hypothetical protein A3C41_06070 [Alphaproteobacteria bacterium RIFCSPHIGHO2_02_FULL_42_30]OFX01332.1 MAG: hypothetical protein A2W62_03430 [Alphaproteobacteria bacterium RIFCSPLOWO2_02_42_7]HBG34330.1 hypothetical protein [Holosporales bacterium]